MKAYSFSAIFDKTINNINTIQNFYGAIISTSADEVKGDVLKTSVCTKFIMDGYTLKSFSFGLIDPKIAPMNEV